MYFISQAAVAYSRKTATEAAWPTTNDYGYNEQNKNIDKSLQIIHESNGIREMRHIEMPKAAPQKSVCHFQELEMILK